MTDRWVILDEANKNRFELEVPEGWIVDVEPLGWSAWAHTPDGSVGIYDTAETKSGAIRKLKNRLDEYAGRNLSKEADKQKCGCGHPPHPGLVCGYPLSKDVRSPNGPLYPIEFCECEG